MYERIPVSERLRPFVNDYRINLFEISFLADDLVERFTSDFRIVADYFVQMRRNQDYVPSCRTIEHVDALLKLFSALTRDNRFEEAQNQLEKGESVTMLSILDKVEARGIALGRNEGIAFTARRMLKLGFTPEQIAQATELSLETIEALR